jgi:stearoyl-CoA desaturase (Delta-9 desaturase)
MSAVSLPTPEAPPRRRHSTLYIWTKGIPFWLLHILPLGAIWTGVKLADVICCLLIYWVGMFAVTGGYHRYFSHKTFKTSRAFQFILAFLAEMTSQKGVLWWASNHRHHHRFSDQPSDIHSPRQKGFWYSHMMWLFDGTDDTEIHRVRDLARFPELRFLNAFWYLPPTLLGVTVFLLLGWSGLLIGFFLGITILWHGTFTINSLSHVFGKRRYETEDDSKNNWLLALITLGEGWHNNHHHYMFSTRQGFFWWEIDVTYYILRALSAVGLVWDLKEPPKEVFAVPAAAPATPAVPLVPEAAE